MGEFICEELTSAAGLVTDVSLLEIVVFRGNVVSAGRPVEGSAASGSDAKGVAQTMSVSCRRCVCCVWTSCICGSVLTCRVVVSTAT